MGYVILIVFFSIILAIVIVGKKCTNNYSSVSNEKDGEQFGMQIIFSLVKEYGFSSEELQNSIAISIVTEGDVLLLKAFLSCYDLQEVEFRNDEKDTALIVAVREKKNEMVKELLNISANIHVKNIYGETPLSIAKKTDNKEIIDLLKLENKGLNKHRSTGKIQSVDCNKYEKSIIKGMISALLCIENTGADTYDYTDNLLLYADKNNDYCIAKALVEFDEDILNRTDVACLKNNKIKALFSYEDDGSEYDED